MLSNSKFYSFVDWLAPLLYIRTKPHYSIFHRLGFSAPLPLYPSMGRASRRSAAAADKTRPSSSSPLVHTPQSSPDNPHAPSPVSRNTPLVLTPHTSPDNPALPGLPNAIPSACYIILRINLAQLHPLSLTQLPAPVRVRLRPCLGIWRLSSIRSTTLPSTNPAQFAVHVCSLA
jgi:hypothetical protein